MDTTSLGHLHTLIIYPENCTTMYVRTRAKDDKRHNEDKLEEKGTAKRLKEEKAKKKVRDDADWDKKCKEKDVAANKRKEEEEANSMEMEQGKDSTNNASNISNAEVTGVDAKEAIGKPGVKQKARKDKKKTRKDKRRREQDVTTEVPPIQFPPGRLRRTMHCFPKS